MAGLFSLACTAQEAFAPALEYKATPDETNVYSLQVEMQGEAGGEAVAGNFKLVATNADTVTVHKTLALDSFPLTGGVPRQRQW